MGEPFEGNLAFFTGCDGHRRGSNRRCRREDLASLGECAHPRRLVHTEARIVIGDRRCLGCVHADPDLGGEPVGLPVLGELPLDGPAPAILNAIENAIGRPVDQIPLLPEDLMEILSG